MNPLLPENCFVPDAEARVMTDLLLNDNCFYDKKGDTYVNKAVV